MRIFFCDRKLNEQITLHCRHFALGFEITDFQGVHVDTHVFSEKQA